MSLLTDGVYNLHGEQCLSHIFSAVGKCGRGSEDVKKETLSLMAENWLEYSRLRAIRGTGGASLAYK